ncbi:RHS repeat-associated core domain-containing protein [Paenibacillus sinopodophylli]|uniref:RHS repeat-associated core domain-containing protein n=1 Tax=Paenibacillus sinopodophylli TaxID=1837342 RepID=UPI001485C58D|nr:RHS repeat-associated core domain-containing protein [Paenibacillus sinopodophylli]
MRTYKSTRIISIILIITFFIGFITPYERQNVSAESEVTAEMDTQRIMTRFSVTEAFIQQYIDAGYTLNEINAALYKAELDGTTFEQALYFLVSEPINDSLSVIESVYNNLVSEPFKDLIIVENNELSVTDAVYEPNVSDSVYQSVSVTENVYYEQMLTQRNGIEVPPLLENAPNYDKTKMNEAPYSVGINNEYISNLSGSLSAQITDMTLPGRNGLGFSLTRQYDSSASQFYDMKYGYNTNIGVYEYYVQYKAVKKKILWKYEVKYKENRWIQEDHGANGSIDYHTMILDSAEKVRGTYPSESTAQAGVDRPFSFQIPEDTIVQLGSRVMDTTTNFPSYIMYSGNGYNGALYKTGIADVYSGEYIPSQSRNEDSTCSYSIAGVYNNAGIWTKTVSTAACPSSKLYSDDGFTGTLTKLPNSQVIKACPTNGTVGYPCTKQWKANYSGTVTKPAKDSRKYIQNYRGDVTMPAYSSSTNYGPWQYYVGGRWRNVFEVSGSPWTVPLTYDGIGTEETLVTQLFAEYGNAVLMKNSINASPNQFIGKKDGENFYISSNPQAQVLSFQTGTTGVTYYNTTETPLNEKLYPIGKGWSWKLPYVQLENGKQTIFTGEGGSYEVEGNTLKGYDWVGVSFTTNTTVSVNGINSKYLLTSVDERKKQYFDQDGRIIQIADAHGNTIQFFYKHNDTYGRKLLSQVKDVIGNSIDISYTSSEVTISKGTETVIYKKSKEENIELLNAVTDAEGRKTTYSYTLSDAKFNLMTAYPERAKSNPYALLTKVQHPTGLKTEYTYEPMPIKRYIGAESTNEAYRITSRVDEEPYENGTSKFYNRHTMLYNDSDVGQAYGQDYAFSTTMNNGLTNVTSHYKKDYVDDQTPTQVYLNQQTVTAEGMEKKVTYEYSKFVGTRQYPVNVPTSTTSSDNKTTDILTSNKQFDDFGNVITSTNLKGQTSDYTYDPVKRWLMTELAPVETGTFLLTTFERNLKGDITKITVRKNDAIGEILQQVSYNGFDVFGNITSMSIANGAKSLIKTTEYSDTYLSAYPTKQSVTVKDVLGVTSTVSTSSEYKKSTGELTAFIDGKNYRTEYQFDKLGRTKQVKYPSNETVNVVYDDILNRITLTDEVGNQIQTRFNGLGMKEEEGGFDQSGYIRRNKLIYDEFGRMVETQDAIGNRSQVQYDNWSRPVKKIAEDASVNHMMYNDIQRKVISTDALQYSQIQSYDNYGQLKTLEEQSNPSSPINKIEEYSYHPFNGQITRKTDANNETTLMSYDLLGQLNTVTNAKQETTRYEYDKVGNLIKLTYADGNEQSKEYDELGRLIKTIDPQLNQVLLYYDANGNKTKQVDKSGKVFHYTYNSRNMLLSKQSPSETISFTYKRNGTRATMSDGTGMTQYMYKPHTGELEEVIYPDGKSISYGYNGNGQRDKMITPFEDTVNYNFTNRSQLENVSWNGVLQASYTYNTNGQMLTQQQPGGAETLYSYTDGNLSSIYNLKQNDTSAYSQYGYYYDLNRNIVRTIENYNGVTNSDNVYTYDSLNRINASTLFNETYTYDQRGNRLTLSSQNIAGLSKNDAYEYDDWDRLKKVKGNNSTSVNYRYNGDNLLVERQEGSVITRYYYDGQDIIAEGIVQSNGNVTEKVSYLRGNGLVMQENANDQKGYYQHNGHGDVVGIRTESGDVLNKYKYDSWGNTISSTETIPNSFRYSGEFWDETTDLQYLRARWYDPSVGRFMNEDTYEGELTNPSTLNLYTYVINNPLLYSDPSGNKHVIHGGGSSGGGGVSWTFAPAVAKTYADALKVGFKVAATISAATGVVGKKKKRDDQIVLYHATSSNYEDDILDGVDVTYGRTNTDFGQGFYVTTIAGQAEDFAINKYGDEGIVMAFIVDKDIFDDYNGKKLTNVSELGNFINDCRSGGCSHNYDYVSGMYLANPITESKEKVNGKLVTRRTVTTKQNYRFTGQQTSIHNQDLANEIVKGFVGTRYY